MYIIRVILVTKNLFQKNTPEEGDYYAPVPPTFDASAFSGNLLTPDFNPDSILNLPGSIINSVTGVTTVPLLISILMIGYHDSILCIKD